MNKPSPIGYASVPLGVMVSAKHCHQNTRVIVVSSPEAACGDVQGEMQVFALHAVWGSIQAALNFTKFS